MEKRSAWLNRVCRAVALAWLLAGPHLELYPFDRNLVDFPQFYLAGALANTGHADAIYPVPRPESHHHPGLPGDSQMRPAYAALAESLGVVGAPRFIGPPPLALLLAPLARFPYPVALNLWTLLLGAAAFGIALAAAQILVFTLGRRSRWEGVLVLAVAFSPRTFIAVAQGNASPLIGLMVGLLACHLFARPIRTGAALALGIVLKYAPAALLPLLIAARRWRALAWAGLFALALGALSLVLMGSGPFLVWWREIVPTLGRPYLDPYNQSIWSSVPRWLGAEEVGGGLRIGIAGAGMLPPVAMASGRGVSDGTCDKSCPQAKNRMKGRR